jgi:ATP-dependent Lon protease
MDNQTEKKGVPDIRERKSDIVLAAEMHPETLSILPLTHRPVFPGTTVPLVVSHTPFIQVIQQAFQSGERYIGAVMVRDNSIEEARDEHLHDTGTLLRIFRWAPFEDEAIQVLVQGVQRFKRKELLVNEPVIRWKVRYLHDREKAPHDEVRAYILEILSSVRELIKLNPLFYEQFKMMMPHLSSEKPGKVMDLIVSMVQTDSDKLQDMLETLDVFDRAKKLLALLRHDIELARIQEKIKNTMDEKISEQQRNFFLHEQLKAIKKELGLEVDEKSSEVEKLEKRLKNLTLSDEAQKVVNDEMDKLRTLEPASPEYHVVRTYLDWLTELPWGVTTSDSLSIEKARQVLDDSHYGLEDVKERILEFISVAIQKGRLSGSILCLVGPPGVGKTSVGKAIADALGRKFFRFSVGGMRDEAEIKGHRRTYIGAMPGKLIQSLKRTESANPVIMIDEIDKLGTSYQGDPASALLEVLDPEQNRDFLDHYLDVRFDLSNILFITTANTLDTIPSPLIDRMEILKLSGYILQEKVEIAKRFLVPHQLSEHGLKKKDAEFSEKAIVFLIDRYAREAGVRSLEKQIKKILRHITYLHAEGKKDKVKVTPEVVEEILGKPVFSTEELYNKGVPGVALGLAWTSMGGATLYVEASGILSKGGGFKQTGQLGKVMQESSEIAYSYIRSRAAEFGVPAGYFDKHFVHLHVPEGATPKDGPSAGITMALALNSLATGKAVRGDLAMTGELTLTGKVLPIGGVREKTIAARRVGVYELILPEDNRRDFDLLPAHLREGMTIRYADHFPDVLEYVYGKTRGGKTGKEKGGEKNRKK